MAVRGAPVAVRGTPVAEKASVKFELDSSLDNWTKFTSPKVVVAGFEWFVTGEYIGCGAKDITRSEGGFYDYSLEDAQFALRNAVVHCAPVKGMKTSIWSCEAKGEIVAFAGSVCPSTNMSWKMNHSKHWSQRFTFHNPDSDAMEIDFQEVFRSQSLPIYAICVDEERMYSKLKLRVEVINHNRFDVCVPQNTMIKSPDDAAKVIVDGKTLWLSKEHFV